MQKKINTMSKNKNVQNVFEIQDKSLDYQIASILTKLDYTIQKQAETIQKQAETDRKVSDLNINIQDLVTGNANRSEIVNQKIDRIETSITEKINKSDENTNVKFTAMQSEITTLKGQDGQKALKILGIIGTIIISVITLIVGAFALKIIKLS